MDLWPVTFRARESLVSTLEGVDGDRWDVASLCDGWTIRQVLAHLILAARPPARRYVPAVLRAKGNFDRANHVLAVADARQPPEQLLAQYRGVVRHKFSPPGWPKAAPLSDILLHSLDVRIPLGAEADEPAEHYEPVLELLFSRVGRSFTSRDRPRGAMGGNRPRMGATAMGRRSGERWKTLRSPPLGEEQGSTTCRAKVSQPSETGSTDPACNPLP